MWQLYKIVNLFYLLVSSYIWFSFLLPRNYIPMGASLLMIICFALGNFGVRLTSKTAVVFLLILFYSLYSVYIIDINYGLLTFLSLFPALLLFVLDRDKQRNLLQFVTKWFSIMMAVSILFYAVHFVIILPSFSFIPGNLSDIYTSFDNYFFFMTTDMYLAENGGIFRFSGPFLEPGHQSMICCLLLFANGYRMKEHPWMWVLVLSVLLSFSLAGYLILIIGWAYLKIRNTYTMLLVVLTLAGSWLTVTMIWENGDNVVNKLILERLEYDNKKGIKGNNRTIAQTDYFFRQCVKDGTYILGVRTLKAMGLKINGAGYKIFILRNGLIGVIFIALIYLMFIPKNVNRKFAIGFFALMILIFLQRAYPLWYSWLLPYVLGLGTKVNIGRMEDYESESEIDDHSVDHASLIDYDEA